MIMLDKPRRIQIRRDRPWKPEGAKVVICDRRGPWGNPFTFGPVARTKTDAFRTWMTTGRYTFQTMSEKYWRLTPREIGIDRQWRLDHLHELADADYIACWCPADNPDCHNVVYLELLDHV